MNFKKKKIVISVFIVLVAILAYIFYTQKIPGNTRANVQQLQEQFKQDFPEQLKDDPLPLSGKYGWQFYLGPAKQVSTHNFLPDKINYQMTGKVYSTDYLMHQLSYDDTQKKWIGTADGVVYVLFFKDINHNTITLYKHKCKNGLAEAVNFASPADDATADHGWNVYTREGVQAQEDDLPLSGVYKDISNQSINLSDDTVTWQGTTYQKMTHHTGEKRWVGQQGEEFLLMFYELPTTDNNQINNNPIKISLQTFTDLEQVYKTKHDQQNFSDFTKQ